MGNLPEEDHAKLTHYMVRDAEKNKSYAYNKPKSGAKEAILEYKLLGCGQRYYLLEVKLCTGRHHQIRCQLAKIGCPIKGDLKYGFPPFQRGRWNQSSRPVNHIHSSGETGKDHNRRSPTYE